MRLEAALPNKKGEFMIKRKIFIATALLASMCMVGGCATSKSGEKAAEATTEAALATEQTTPVELKDNRTGERR